MDLWFGDSWAVGNELNYYTDKKVECDPNIFINSGEHDNPLKAFSTLVSNFRNQKFINFARTAGSLDFSLNQLLNFCNVRKDLLTEHEGNITVFLCTTAQIRGYGFDHILNKHHHFFNDTQKSVTPIYDSLIAINSFYSTCKMHNIKCIIIPIFCNIIIPKTLEHIVLFKDAVLTDKSLVEHTFNEKLIDDRLYEMPNVSEHDIQNHLKNKDWIKPCQMHPNTQGHKKLAYKLIELLEKNNF